MKKKPKPELPHVTFHECKLVEITDPAEQAEIDRRFREAERAIEGDQVIRRRRRTRRSK